jgi:hypothetical protein
VLFFSLIEGVWPLILVRATSVGGLSGDSVGDVGAAALNTHLALVLQAWTWMAQAMTALPFQAPTPVHLRSC